MNDENLNKTQTRRTKYILPILSGEEDNTMINHLTQKFLSTCSDIFMCTEPLNFIFRKYDGHFKQLKDISDILFLKCNTVYLSHFNNLNTHDQQQGSQKIS